MKKKLYFISSNQNKIDEINKLISGKVELLSLKDLNWNDDIPEEHDTFFANSKQKVDTVISKYLINAFADDSGLEVLALDNKPGVFSARYSKINNSTLDNVDFLLEEMKNIENRKARFICFITLFWEKAYYTFEGKVEGKITYEKRGNHGFAYDSVFIPDGYDMTFGEMDINLKNQISHRYNAIKKLLDFIDMN